jgi:hypothetical protein
VAGQQFPAVPAGLRAGRAGTGGTVFQDRNRGFPRLVGPPIHNNFIKLPKSDLGRLTVNAGERDWPSRTGIALGEPLNRYMLVMLGIRVYSSRMAMYMPQLDEPSRRVLQAIRRLGVAPGWQLMKEAPVTATELVEAVQKLMASSLIKASGNFSNPEEIGNAYFNIQPSNAGLVDYVLNV